MCVYNYLTHFPGNVMFLCMSDPIFADPVDVAALVQLGGDLNRLVAFDSAEARTYLKATEFTESNPLRVQAEIYSTDNHNRKPIVLSADAVEKLAAAYAGLPVLDRRHGAGLEGLLHGPSEVVGAVEGATVEQRANGSAGLANLALWGADVIREFRGGVRTQFSIGFAETEDTTALCSICDYSIGDDDLCAGEDEHHLGVDGCRAVLSDVEPLEVTRLFNPAVRGTGVRSVFLDMDSAKLGGLVQRFLAMVSEDESINLDLGSTLVEKIADDISEPAEEAFTARELAFRSQAEEAQRLMHKMRGELLYAEAQAAMLLARKQGKLGRGDASQLTQLFIDSGTELAARWVGAIEPHPAHIAELTRSGMGTELAIDDPLMPARNHGDWSAQLTSAAHTLSRTENITYEAAWSRLYNQYRPVAESFSREGGPAQPRR